MFYYFVFHYYLASCLSLLFFFSDLCFNLVIIGWIPSKCTMDGSFLNDSPSWTEIGLVLIICGNLLNTEMNHFSLTLVPIPLNIYIYTHIHTYILKWYTIQITTGKSSTSLELIQMYSFWWLSNTPLCICTTAFLSIHLLMDI